MTEEEQNQQRQRNLPLIGRLLGKRLRERIGELVWGHKIAWIPQQWVDSSIRLYSEYMKQRWKVPEESGDIVGHHHLLAGYIFYFLIKQRKPEYEHEPHGYTFELPSAKERMVVTYRIEKIEE